ncbi:uncharacterized protein V1516DRAFT_286442 [Lipomyces oligophaga]|uniref:uncharacterized protein n=1 Tax=Lipomyces oligophaga TaxID=45792 RepID=UPI0034CF1A6E
MPALTPDPYAVSMPAAGLSNPTTNAPNAWNTSKTPNIPSTPKTPNTPNIQARVSPLTSQKPSTSPCGNLGYSPQRRHSHAESLIGSYEESLLSGRTSAPGSRPAVTFKARIGVLGTGSKCPESLKCPKHLNLEFEAVYYNWHDSPSGPSMEHHESPYVGVLDLEEYYRNKRISHSNRRRERAAKEKCLDRNAFDFVSDSENADDRNRTSPGYRIPRQGQIQIVISNPNRTAIKLFLIPYDLRNMPPHTRTFIRQKTGVALSEQHPTKYAFRQAIHLHVVCTSAGRFYLTRTVRMVFENRALDATSASAPSNQRVPSLLKDKFKVESIMGDFSAYSTDLLSSSSGPPLSHIDQRRTSAGSRVLGSSPLSITSTLDQTGNPFSQSQSEAQSSSPSITGLSPRLSRLSVSLSAVDESTENILGLGISQPDLQSLKKENTTAQNPPEYTWAEIYSRRLNSSNDCD